MKSILIPLEFLKAIGEKQPIVRIYWIKWLSEYTDELFRADFPTFFLDSMKDKNLNLETIKEAYDYGITFFKDGFTFYDEPKKRKAQKTYSDSVKEVVNKILDYLNSKTQSTYTPNKANMECIVARINEGFSISDFMRVIDKKTEQWYGTEQQKYLRPTTLFQASKFENYLNEPENPTKDAKRKPSNIQKLTNAAHKAKQLFG